MFEFDSELYYRLVKNTLVTQDKHWIWLGENHISGYGITNYKNNRHARVHRLSCYLFHNLDLNVRKQLACHKTTCNRKNCWNPEHLYVGNQANNMKDTVRCKTHYQTIKTHCPKGHEYDNKNTFLYQERRYCRACMNERMRQKYHRDKNV